MVASTSFWFNVQSSIYMYIQIPSEIYIGLYKLNTPTCTCMCCVDVSIFMQKLSPKHFAHTSARSTHLAIYQADVYHKNELVYMVLALRQIK